MKRILTLALALLLLLAVGCSSTNAAQPVKNNPDIFDTIAKSSPSQTSETRVQTNEVISSTYIPENTPEAESEKNMEQPSTQIDMQEKSFEFTDEDGYKYLVVVKISPWLFYSTQKEALQSLWANLPVKEMLPTIESWGFETESSLAILGKNYYSLIKGNQELFRCRQSGFDMYYSVGTITIKNITQGFDITESNSRKIIIDLVSKSFFFFFFCDKYANCWPVICKVFYSNKPTVYGQMTSCVIRWPLRMNRNQWGPVTFLLAYGESFSPNEPDGLYREYLSQNSNIKFGAIDSIGLNIVESVSFDLDVIY